MGIDTEKVVGLCHLVANEIYRRVDGKIIGVATESGKTWHYGVFMPDGRVLDSKGEWDSKEDFLNAANEKWGRNFEIVYPSISKEEIEIFDATEKKKAKEFAEALVKEV